MELTPVDLKKVEQHTANIYESVIVAARKARQINDQNKLEYNQRVAELIPTPEDDFDDRANPDLVKISQELEKRLKPHQIALNELLDKGIPYRYKDDK